MLKNFGTLLTGILSRKTLQASVCLSDLSDTTISLMLIPKNASAVDNNNHAIQTGLQLINTDGDIK